MVDPEPETTPAPPQTAPAGSESVSPSHPRRIALAHDWLVNDRGGEAVLAHIADAALERGSPGYLYTLFDGHGPYANAIDRFPTRASPLNRLPDAARRWLLPAYPRAVESLGRALARDHAREPIDLLISTSSGLIKGLRPPPGVPHLCYCHAPARYLWSATDQYTRGAAGRVRAAGFAPVRPLPPSLGRAHRVAGLPVRRQQFLHPRPGPRAFRTRRRGRPPPRAHRSVHARSDGAA
jgi:hypothetical protein